MKNTLLATGTVAYHEPEGDDMPLEEAVVEITKDVTLRVFNWEAAVLEFGSNQRIEFSFTEEIAGLLVNIDGIKPVELFAAIGKASL